jgi:hypothetical protein
VSENRVLRRIFGPKREEVAGGWRRLHNEELHQILLGGSNQGGCNGRVMWHAWEMRNVSMFLSEDMEGRDHSEDDGVDWTIL